MYICMYLNIQNYDYPRFWGCHSRRRCACACVSVCGCVFSFSVFMCSTNFAYIYIDIHIFTYTYIYIYIYIYVHIYIYIYIYIYTCIFTSRRTSCENARDRLQLLYYLGVQKQSRHLGAPTCITLLHSSFARR